MSGAFERIANYLAWAGSSNDMLIRRTNGGTYVLLHKLKQQEADQHTH